MRIGHLGPNTKQGRRHQINVAVGRVKGTQRCFFTDEQPYTELGCETPAVGCREFVREGWTSSEKINT